MARPPFLPVIRELARCYQAFEAYSAAQIREFGLTPSQFDIIATLGNTPGMMPKELGEKTLITKGTLTGVVDRLAAKGLVRRLPSAQDGRSRIVQLTPAGAALFETVFPTHLEYVGMAFAGFDSADYARIEAALCALRRALEKGGRN